VGAIIYWGLLRFTAVLIAAWALYSYVPNYGDWWSLFFVSVAVIVIYPAQLSFMKHQKDVRRASRNALCATCKHFIADNTLCAILDEHVTRNYTPCGGDAWEPIQITSVGN